MPELPDPKPRQHPYAEFYREPMLRSMNRTVEPASPPPDALPDPPRRITAAHEYAELQVTSNFTFLTGASHPDEMVHRAAALGHAAIAVTDRNSLAGIVRAHVAARELGMPFIVGCRLALKAHHPDQPPADELSILVYPTDAMAYGRLCRLLTLGKRRAAKGHCDLSLHDLIEHGDGLLAVIVPPRDLDHVFLETIHGLRDVFADDRLSLASSLLYGEDDRDRLHQLAVLASHVRVPLVATNDVHYHEPARRPLQDVLTCIRHGCTIEQAGLRLFANAERCLKPPQEMARMFVDHPQAIRRTIEIAKRAGGFSLDQLRYQYPDEVCPAGQSPIEHLAALTWRGAAERYGPPLPEGEGRGEGVSKPHCVSVPPSPLTPPPKGEGNPSPLSPIPPAVRQRIEHELTLIDELNYAPYFLTVHDLVVFARSRGILCQGRGAAANSAVCYCLGVTAVDPDRIDLLFERFISRERNEPPDIDIDFEHERREEVIQYIYGKYGRERAALTAEVISYRGRSAVREVGKAMGLSLDCVDRLAKDMDWWSDRVNQASRIRAMGLDPAEPTMAMVMRLSQEIIGFPRHLSQHVGGFVITRGALCEMVPVENAAMPDRTIIEWDKDDVDAMGMLKVDVLGLGMLTCIRKCFEMVSPSPPGGGVRGEGGAESSRAPESCSDSHSSKMETQSTSKTPSPLPSPQGRGSESSSLQERGSRSPVNPKLLAYARELRDKQPDAERLMWRLLHNRQLLDLKFRRQHQVAPYIIDFYCKELQLAIELDGGQHNQADERRKDEQRTRFLEQRGIQVLRFWDHDVLRDTEAVLEAICFAIQDARGKSHSRGPDGCTRNSEVPSPQPSPEGRGSDATSPSPSGGGVRGEGGTEAQCGSETPSPQPSPQGRGSRTLQLHTVPPEDPAVYDMICKADTVGVFQIESRAQMTMLPRLRPRCYYDLVIEVAIVRPGPIQGDMVHPYLRRRNGQEPVTYPTEAVKRVLGRTLGVPLFQEQAMALAIVAAGFTAGEADRLRRAMAAWKRKGDQFARFESKFIDGMLSRGYQREFAQRCFNQLRGFSEYGFPESHAASFALLVYVSCWLKKYHPAAFAAALINSQPMGFYAPAQIVRDAQDHGVDVRPVDVNWSAWDCTLEGSPPLPSGEGWGEGVFKPHCVSAPPSPLTPPPEGEGDGPSLRLGMRLVKGLRQPDADAIAGAVRQHGSFDSIDALRRAAGVSVAALRRLAAADAFGSMGLDRQSALWHVRALRDGALAMFDSCHAPVRREPALPPVAAPRRVIHDYESLGLSLKAHPFSFMRSILDRKGATRAVELADQRRWPQGRSITVAGLVLVRQRPATASGVVFMTLEDETGIANLIVRPKMYERFRRAARHGVAILARGTVERQGEVVHVLTRSLASLDEELGELVVPSRDFH